MGLGYGNITISDQTTRRTIMLEYIKIDGTNLVSSRIALGTWAIGGWMWGGTDEKESIRTIHAALDLGINLTTPRPFTVLVVPKNWWAMPSRIVAETALSLPAKSASIGLKAKSNVTPHANAFSRSSRIRCVGSKPTTSISIRCTGLTR